MTIEERVKWLEDMQEKTQRTQAKNEELAAQVLESIIRLERIAMMNTLSIDDIEKRLSEMEKRKTPKVN